MSEQADGNRSDQDAATGTRSEAELDPSSRAENLEQRYVGEHQETEEILEGLDPERPDAQKTTGDVEGVAPGSDAEGHVESMSREDP
jgi:hypothetical protein